MVFFLLRGNMDIFLDMAFCVNIFLDTWVQYIGILWGNFKQIIAFNQTLRIPVVLLLLRAPFVCPLKFAGLSILAKLRQPLNPGKTLPVVVRRALGRSNHAVRCRVPQGPVHLVFNNKIPQTFFMMHHRMLSLYWQYDCKKCYSDGMRI
jgi:hypothetical protein